MLAIVNDVTNKKLNDLRDQAEGILDTLIEGEMCTVFTNDVKYISARDDLLAVSCLFMLENCRQQPVRC